MGGEGGPGGCYRRGAGEPGKVLAREGYGSSCQALNPAAVRREAASRYFFLFCSKVNRFVIRARSAYPPFWGVWRYARVRKNPSPAVLGGRNRHF